MNGRVAKQLRRNALIIAREQFKKTGSRRMQYSRGGPHVWEPGSPKALYRVMKKAYRELRDPELTRDLSKGLIS